MKQLGSRRELFVDDYLVERMAGVSLRMHEPTMAPSAASPPPLGGYRTVIRDTDRYRMYYRTLTDGQDGPRYDGHSAEITCYAESCDGREWELPDLGLFDLDAYEGGNAILAGMAPYSHNFSPFKDSRPGVPSDECYKALAGVHPGGIGWMLNPETTAAPEAVAEARRILEEIGQGGLVPFVSRDGIHWRRRTPGAVITSEDFAFDSQNLSFWSEHEQRYVCYFRSWQTPHGRLRTISRTTSDDFLHWTEPIPMNPNEPGEHLYTSGTHPYFRAQHIYVAMPTRFQPDRGESTDILFMTSRGGNEFQRTFKEVFIRPGLDPARWGNRANYAALNVVPTGPAEMSIYVRDLRYVLRTDGFSSVHAGHEEGELVTKPFTFEGSKLSINVSTSAAGTVRAELQDADGRPVPGFTLDDCPPVVGDAVERIVEWKKGDVGALAGTPVRLRFAMNEADLYSMRFA